MSLGDPASSDSNSDSDEAVVIHRDDVSNYNPEQILPSPPKDIEAIRSWLQPTLYDIAGGEYRKHLASHVEGTGTWLTSSKTYQEWLYGTKHGLLWIKGIPGSGKSVVAANLIRELARSNPGSPILFFFFRQIIDANHNPQALLRDWMDQLLEYSPPLQIQLMAYIKDHRSIITLSIEDLWKDLHMALTRLPGKVFCVADALDEMDEDRGHDAFLEAIGSLGQLRPETVKVLITSRLVPRVEAPLRKIPGLHLRLEESLVDVDISTYVHFSLSTSTVPIPKSDWKVIANAVPGRANGLFLYAKLAMDAFLEPGADISTVLSQLPADLNALYTDLLKEHAQRSGVEADVQRLILRSVTHATRPLRLLELAEMIRVCGPDNHNEGPMRDLKATKELIRAACGPLLEILADETVSVIHHSFTEYLNGTTRDENDDRGYPVLKPGPTHAELVLACLHYLQSGCLSTNDDAEEGGKMGGTSKDGGWVAGGYDIPEGESKLRLAHPFFDYAASNWADHIRASDAAGYDQTKVNIELATFLERAESFEGWLENRWPRRYDSSNPVTQLHVAANGGLLSYTKALLEKGEVVVDARDAGGRTPLWWAATEGHTAVIQELVAAGANPDAHCNVRGMTPLHEAASKNHSEAARALVEAGVDPLTPKKGGYESGMPRTTPGSTAYTPLIYACESGHLETVDVFMPFLKDITTVHHALVSAAGAGRWKVVSLILEHPGVNVNANICGNTPLFRACGSHDAETVRILLQAGADPNIDHENGPDESEDTVKIRRTGGAKGVFNCMHKLCSVDTDVGNEAETESQREIFSLLIQAGSDIHRRSPSGMTALHYAASISGTLTKLLLDAGADPNAADDCGQTPLHKATFEENMVALIEGHADIHRRDAAGLTPLLSSLSSSYEKLSLKLLEYGADANVVDNEGNGPLHSLLQRLHPSAEIIKALLKANADPNLKNHDGLTPLLSITWYSTETRKAISLLLQAGADIDAVNKYGKTFLALRLDRDEIPAFGYEVGWDDEYEEGWHHGYEEGCNHDLGFLIRNGASTSSRDFNGRTLLHSAVISLDLCGRHGQEPDLSRLDFVLGLGLDVKATDYRGNGLLHELALLGSNHKRKNHLSSVEWFIPVWKKLVGLGLDLQQGNYAGRTPLHMLCAASTIHDRGPGDTMPIDFVISKTNNLDRTDNDGNTALHIAVAVGDKEIYVKRLLDAGADPTVATREGLTALHLACRSRNPNIVGLLLNALRKRQYINLGRFETQPQSEAAATPEPVVGVNAGAFERLAVTPLYYACRSGRPETVALLLEAGADVGCTDVFQACSEFDEEDDLWRHAHATEDGQGNGDAVDLKLDDKSRRTEKKAWKRFNTLEKESEKLGVHDTTRIAEILGMLARHGARLPKIDTPPGSHGAIRVNISKPGSLSMNYDAIGTETKASGRYAASCLRAFQIRETDATETENLKRQQSFSDLMHQSVQEASVRVLREFKPLEPHGQQLFHRFMVQREYHLVEELARLGISFLPHADQDSVSFMGLLIQHGFYSLVESIGSLEAASHLEKGDWHAFGDNLQPGLWFARRDLSKSRHAGCNPVPFIIEAVRSSLPNMEVLRLLVETFKVDINEIYYTSEYGGDGHGMGWDNPAPEPVVYETIPNDSALHSLALGKFWWHVYQALPYLLKAGAHLEARDLRGQTPLHIALSSEGEDPGTFSREAAKVLIAAGADVNAVSDDGRSCLAHAGNDIVIIKLLISHGATVTADALFAAIEAANVSVLQALLSGGANPNMRQDPPPLDDEQVLEMEGSRYRRTWGNPLGIRRTRRTRGRGVGGRGSVLDGVMLHEDFPLYRAVQTGPTLVRILLDHGADPFAKFLRVLDYNKIPTPAVAPGGVVPEGYEECMVLHRLLQYSEGTVGAILRTPGLDVNRRDARGLTVLLAACGGHNGPDHTDVSDGLNEDTTDAESEAGDAETTNDAGTTVFQRLRSLGADLRARDNRGCNVVHHMIGHHPNFHTLEHFERSLAEALALAPELINQSDSDGQTPLFYAVSNINQPRVELLNILLSAGADPLTMDGSGDTVLHYLARDLCAPEICTLFKALVDRGVDINTQNSRGESPLFEYSVRPNPSGTLFYEYFQDRDMEPLISEMNAMPMLVALGADFLVRDKKGRGLLHVAASGRVERFKELMGLGLDPMLEDEVQQTAIDVAAACGNAEILALFEKKDGVK